MGQLDPLTCRPRDVSHGSGHAVALVPSPVRQGHVDHPAGPGIGREGADEEEVHAARLEDEAAASRVETHETRGRGEPCFASHEQERKDQKTAEDRDHQNPVQDLQRTLDTLTHEQDKNTSQKGRHTDPVDDVRVFRPGEGSGIQEEDRAGCSTGPPRPSHLQEVEQRIEAGPEGGVRTRAHEPRERGLTGGQRVAHQLRVEHRLQERGDTGDPQ